MKCGFLVCRPLEWSPNGKRIASCAEGEYPRIWDSQIEDANSIWRADKYRERLWPHVRELFQEHLRLEPVVASLRSDKSITPELIEVAVQLAKSSWPKSSEGLFDAAQLEINPILGGRGAPPLNGNIDVEFGLALARAAVIAEPSDPYRNEILAAAQLENGLYKESLGSFQRAVSLASGEMKEQYLRKFDEFRKRLKIAQGEGE